MAYLELAQTRAYLISTNVCPDDSEFCGATIDLEGNLEIVDALMDGWLNAHYAPHEVCETRQTNWQGAIILRHTPVIQMLSVEILDASQIQNNRITPVSSLDPLSIWDGNITLQTGHCDCDRYTYQVKYIAGLDPLPSIFKVVARNILKQINLSGYESLLSSPKDLVEVSNPSYGGSFKQRFQRATAKGTLLDRLMSPLAIYKRIVF